MGIRTSKALSKKLYKAGLIQKSEKYFMRSPIEPHEWVRANYDTASSFEREHYSSYTLEELLRLVPKKCNISFALVDGFYYCYSIKYTPPETGSFKHKDSKTAISNLLLWLLDNGYMKREKR